MLIETFPVGPLGCSCSILVDPESKSAVVIDPGGDFVKIRARVERAGATVAAILHTHTHIDHVGATAELQSWSSASARIHESDRFLYELLPVQAAMIGIPLPSACELEGNLVDEGTVTVGSIELSVLHTPGHTPGSVSFLTKTADGPLVFTGDTLFRRGIGRTDLWGGDSDLILRSLRGRLLSLDDVTKVIPGHGLPTTIGEERRENPFLRRP